MSKWNYVPMEQRRRYWDHFIRRWALERLGYTPAVGAADLAAVQEVVLGDDVLWGEIESMWLMHGSGLRENPELLRRMKRDNYAQMAGLFWMNVNRKVREVNDEKSI